MSPFVEADGGTIFLDELGELPLDTQPKLLRALAERRIQSVGGSGYVPFDARIVAATRRDLQRAVNEDAFRSSVKEIRTRKDRERAAKLGTQPKQPVAEAPIPQQDRK